MTDKKFTRIPLFRYFVSISLMSTLVLAGCRSRQPDLVNQGNFMVVTVESFLADITRNVAGEHVVVESLVAEGMDPHTFEPIPRDIIMIAESRLLIVNGAGLESWLNKMIDQQNIATPVIEASAGLVSRTPSSLEKVDEPADPHFWLDPISVKTYVRNIQDALTTVDPANRNIYEKNANSYLTQLDALDLWITGQVAQIHPENLLLVTNHESFGYYADRYGFKIVGTIIPSISTGAMPTPKQLTNLIQNIKETKTKAIFMEAGSNPELAQMIAQETGVKIITGLLTHSLSGSEGPALSYIAMMKYDTKLIVDALK